MPINPFYTSSGGGLGAGIGSLAQAFAPDPANTARMMALTASAEHARAQTGQINARMGGYSNLAQVFQRAAANPEGFREVIGGLAQTMDPQALAQAGSLLRAFGFSQGVDSPTGDRLMMGAGQGYGQTREGNRYNVDTDAATSRANAGTAAGASIAGARIRADADLEGVRLQESGRDRRMAPEINPGNVVVVPGNSPLAGRADANGRIAGAPRPPTFDEARGAQVPVYLNPPDGEDPAVQGRRRDVVAPSVSSAEVRGPAASTQRPPIEIGAADAKAIDEQIGVNLPDGAAIDPAAAQQIRVRVAELWQQNRNLPLAAQTAVQEFMARSPPRTDNRLNPFSSPRYGVPATGAPAARTDTPAAAPGRPQPGQRVRQNGVDYIIQPDGTARPAA